MGHAMSLLTHYDRAMNGETVTFRPQGQSMKGLINSGALVEVRPCNRDMLEADDIVLVKVKGNVYLHKILARQGSRLLIGNNRGGTNGWVGEEKVAGICVSVDGRKRSRIDRKVK